MDDSNAQMKREQEEFNQAFDELWGPITHHINPVTLPEEIADLEHELVHLMNLLRLCIYKIMHF